MIKGSWLLGVLLVITGIAMSTQANEEPVWSPVATLDDVELRSYAPVVQARTALPGGIDSSDGFRTLARYIFGGNDRSQEIAMTAPVEQTLTGTDDYMAFYMPAELKLDQLPEPNDDSVTLHAVPARTVAVIAFSGWARDKVVQENSQALLATLASHGIELRGQVSLAQYNPPWTLPWKRRNEVIVEIAARQ